MFCLYLEGSVLVRRETWKKIMYQFTRMCNVTFRVVTSPFGWFRAQQEVSAYTNPIGGFL
jgi:hypothetical protein